MGIYHRAAIAARGSEGDIICLVIKCKLSLYSTGNLVRLGYPRQTKLTQTTLNVHGQPESNPHLPNANYIPLARFGTHVWARVGSVRLCVGYQHVGISKAKWLLWGSKPMQRPNTSDFALILESN